MIQKPILVTKLKNNFTLWENNNVEIVRAKYKQNAMNSTQ